MWAAHGLIIEVTGLLIQAHIQMGSACILVWATSWLPFLAHLCPPSGWTNHHLVCASMHMCTHSVQVWYAQDWIHEWPWHYCQGLISSHEGCHTICHRLAIKLYYNPFLCKCTRMWEVVKKYLNWVYGAAKITNQNSLSYKFMISKKIRYFVSC